MKILKIVSICLVSILIIFCSFKVSKGIVEDMNSRYVPKNPLVTKKPIASKDTGENKAATADIDKMISHIVNGTQEISLPVRYEKNYIVYEKKLYVTNNKGRTWMMVPEDNYAGYARISEYLDAISESNIFVSSNKVSIVYGGRGSENISIITTDSKGEVWSVGTISKTATHDLQNGYDKMYIKLLEDGRTGYIAAIRNQGKAEEKIIAYRSVNTGVTWDNVDAKDVLYKKIMDQFGL